MAKNPGSRRTRSRIVDTCKQANSLIMAYLNDEMGAATRRAFEKHLSICPDCIAFLNTYKKTILTVQSLLEKSPFEIKKGVQQSIKKKIKEKLIQTSRLTKKH